MKIAKILIIAIVLSTFIPSASHADEVDIDRADVTFPITDVSQDGRNLKFTITKNARSLKEDAQDSDYTAMKKIGTSDSINCPMVDSDRISKNVIDYDIFSGKAVISANFDNADTAKKIANSKCLVVKRAN